MLDIFQQFVSFMLNQSPIIQGFTIGILVTGVPGPLNLIAVHKTVHGDYMDAFKLTYQFAGLFTIVAFISIIINYTLIEFDTVPVILNYFTENKQTILKYGALAALFGGIFFFIKKASFHKMKNSKKVIFFTLLTGVLLFPGNWVIFIASYTTLKTNNELITFFDLLLTLPGVFLFCAISWLGTMAVSVFAKKWINKKANGDKTAVEKMLNKLIGSLFIVLSIMLFIASFF